VSFVSFMSITMPPMIDPVTPLQTHSSLEIHSHVQTHTMVEKTARPAIRAIFVREVSDLRPLRSPTAPCAAVGPSRQAACHCSSR